MSKTNLMLRRSKENFIHPRYFKVSKFELPRVGCINIVHNYIFIHIYIYILVDTPSILTQFLSLEMYLFKSRFLEFSIISTF